MRSTALLRLYEHSPFYSGRLSTDRLFSLGEGAIRMRGELDDAVRFIEDYQLLDAPLWEKFVTQFRDTDPKADDADHGWRGEYWGKMMRGACFVYAYTQNPTLYRVLSETVRDMMSTQDALGRISTYSVEGQYHGWDIWARKYVLLGMQYFLEICRDKAFAAEITDSMCRQADYMIATLGKREEGKTPITKASDHWLGMNSSSLLEPIVRLYQLTSEKRYLDFATYIVDCGVIDTPELSLFELAAEDRIDPHDYPVVKAYEMMSCFEGLLEYYRVTGIEKWRRAVVNFAKRVRLTEISVIGSSGCTHELFDHTIVREANTKYDGVMQETCVTVTWMKFCYQLLCLTGDAAYADEMETSLYNAMLGSINYHKDERNGNLPFDSYSPLLFNTRLRGVGGKKIMADGSFYGCCACIGSAGLGLLGKVAAMASSDGIVLNLYAPMTVRLPLPDGEEVTLRMTTDYPVTGDVRMSFDEATPEFDLALRIPAFSARTVLTVAGEEMAVSAGEYAHIRRAFRPGEEIVLTLDMRTKLHHALPDATDENAFYHVALTRGPITLARDARLPGKIEEALTFAPDAEGFVPCRLDAACEVEHTVACLVTTADGREIPMIDYEHAGRTWDERSLLTVWIPTKDYFTVKLDEPFIIEAPNVWDLSPRTNYLAKKGDRLMLSDAADSFSLECSGDGLAKIRLADGSYLAVTSDGKYLTFGEVGDDFRLSPVATGRYHIYTTGGMALAFNGDFDGETDERIFLTEPSFFPKQIFRLHNVK